jgi:hypothetical protein
VEPGDQKSADGYCLGTVGDWKRFVQIFDAASSIGFGNAYRVRCILLKSLRAVSDRHLYRRSGTAVTEDAMKTILVVAVFVSF